MVLHGPIDQATFDALNPVIKAEYIPVPGLQGQFIPHFQGTNGFALENVEGLKTSLQNARNDHDATKRKYAGFENIDLPKVHGLLAREKEIGEWKPDANVEHLVQDRVKQIEEKANKRVTDAEAKAQANETQTRSYLKKVAALQALNKHNPKAAKAMLPHVLDRLEVFETKDDKGETTYEVFAVGPDKRPVISKESNNDKNMLADELVGTVLRSDPEFEPFYPSSGAGGSGSPVNGTGRPQGGGSTAQLAAIKDPNERLKRARESSAAGAVAKK